jgi:hypothetical protein
LWYASRSLFLLAVPALLLCATRNQPDIKTIVERSVAANDKDFEAGPQFNYKEKDRQANGTKTFQVTMIDGTPYQRLLAVDGKPLSKEQAAEEWKKQEQATSERRAQTAEQRNKRIADYAKDRKRDHIMMSQLSQGFVFKLMGARRIGKRSVWVLSATPKPGYQPPNMESQVLIGMRGEMWIDQQTYEWVKVTSEVIRPVSIEGFLAEVEPGTRFEIEKTPVAAGIWQVAHFTMQSHAKVLHLINKDSAEEDWYYDFTPANGSEKTESQLPRKAKIGG